MLLKYMGHSSFRLIINDKVIYIDPFVGDYSLPADLVLITHEHNDHNKVSLITQKPDTIIYRSKDFIEGETYKTKSFDKIQIVGTPAYNSNHLKSECVGFIIMYNDKKLYFAGDTSYVPYMNELAKYNLDYCFLPTDGVYNMNAIEATRCANIINAKSNVPIHTHLGMLFDQKIAANFNPSNLKILIPGDEINI